MTYECSNHNGSQVGSVTGDDEWIYGRHSGLENNSSNLTCDRNFTDISTNSHDEWSRGRVGCCCHYHACCTSSKNITEDDNNETDEWIYSYNIFMNTCQHVCDFNETTKMEENTSNGWIYGRFDHMENVQIHSCHDKYGVESCCCCGCIGCARFCQQCNDTESTIPEETTLPTTNESTTLPTTTELTTLPTTTESTTLPTTTESTTLPTTTESTEDQWL
jgi:hypothetical protein